MTTPILELVHPDDLARAERALADVAGGRDVESVVLRLRTRYGGWVAVDSTEIPIRGPRGEVAYVLATARDVSEGEELRLRVAEVDALYRVAEAISHSTALDELLEEGADALLDATGAGRAAVLLYDDEDVLRFRVWRRLSDEYRGRAEGHSPWPLDATDPQPLLVADVARSSLEPELEQAAREAGIGALALSPLVHGGRLLGAIALYRDEPHVWGERETRLCRTIASHLASATVRTRARNALRASREQLETILRTVDEGIVVQDRRGRLVYANAAAAALIGFETTDELLGADRGELQARFELYDEHGRPLSPEDLPGRRALRGESTEVTVRYRHRSTGEERWSVVRANPVPADDGTVELSVSVVRDVTAAKLADGRAQASVERLGFLARAGDLLAGTLDFRRTLGALAQLAVPSFAGHVTVDLYEDGVLRCVAARHVDPKRTELMLALREEYPPTVLDAPGAGRAPQRGGSARARPPGARRVDGPRRTPRTRDPRLANTSGIVAPLIARGRTLGAISFGTIAAQPAFDDRGSRRWRGARAADLARARQRDALRRGAGSRPRRRGARVRRRRRDPRGRGRRRAALEPRGREDVPDPGAGGDRPPDGRRDRGLAVAPRPHRVDAEPQAGGTAPMTLPVEVHGEERWLSISAVRFPGGTVYAFRDVTDERAVEQMKTDFVSTVSHELRTPLAAIYGAAMTLRRADVALEESQRDRGCWPWSPARPTAWRASSTTSSGRAASSRASWASRSRAATGRRSPRRWWTRSAPTRRRPCRSSWSRPPTSPPVSADPDKLRQILTNLVDNAIKYSPDGGRVDSRSRRRADAIRFTITDEGLGIPPAEHGRIFEKFFRLDPDLTRGVGGTGLGLYISRELVDRMNGRIWVVSDGSRGSAFHVELPAAS